MYRTIQKAKRKIKRTFDRIWQRLTFLFKMTLALIVLFFVVILFLSRPHDSAEDFTGFDQGNALFNSENEEKEHFIQTIAPYAQGAETKYGTRPSVLIAQAALESDWGRSELSKESNNYFGIKATGNGGQYATREFDESEWVQVNATFKEYDSMEDSVMDYAHLLKHGTSWNENLYRNVIEADNYKDAAEAVEEAGYATDPDYAEKLIRIIEQHDLHELDDGS